MKNYEMIPTEENLIQALSEDILNRNKDIVYFYNLLMAQEGSSSIALDGRWGSGKTFFVRQTMLVINAQNQTCSMDANKREKITYSLPLQSKEVDNTNCSLAVYYDAWKNDNDIDPMLSIVYEITRQVSVDYNYSNKKLIDMTVGLFEVLSGRSVSKLLENLMGDNPYEKLKEQKEIDERIKHFFSEILLERGNKLIVFIDELDRCKPTYAVRLLEQIKHYLTDDRITFVFSVNKGELQHTIKKHYGNDFDACRYLDRFFDLSVMLPPADMAKYYATIGMNTGYISESVTKRIIEMYNLELRSVSRFYRQVKTAVYVPVHAKDMRDFAFPEGKAKEFMLTFIVPLIIGLRIVNISIYDEFVNGKNVVPLLELFKPKELGVWGLSGCLNRDESFELEEGKRVVSTEEIIKRVYNAIFVKEYTNRYYSEQIGQCEFDVRAKEFVISASNMMSNYADYNI